MVRKLSLPARGTINIIAVLDYDVSCVMCHVRSEEGNVCCGRYCNSVGGGLSLVDSPEQSRATGNRSCRQHTGP